MDWFFHKSVVEGRPEGFGRLREFDAVEFEGDAASPKGPRVTKLSKLTVPTPAA